MGDKTKISWTDASWNPIRGCSRVSEGCRHCYAEAVAARFSGPGQPYEGLATRKLKVISDDEQRMAPRWTGEIRFVAEHLADPLKWKKPRRIFVNSMSDLFHEKLSNEQIAAIFGVMAACPQHQFQILTKRARRMREWFEWAASHGDGHDLMRFGPSGLLTCAWEACSGDAWGDIEPPGVLESLPSADVFGTAWPLPNVWIGVSVENQAAADERIPELLRAPAAAKLRDEAVRLRAEVATHDEQIAAIMDGTFSVGDGTAQKEIERLRAEVERLRAAKPDLVHIDRDGESLCGMELHEGPVPLTSERGEVTCIGCWILRDEEAAQAVSEVERLRGLGIEAAEHGARNALQSPTSLVRLYKIRAEIERKP